MQNSVESISPQKLETEGKTAYGNGDFSKAESSFTAAQAGYSAQGDHLMAAEMANNRCVALLQMDDPNTAKAALKAVDDTVAVFKDAGDQTRQALALGNRASAYEATGDLEQAIIDYQESASILKEIGAEDLRMDVVKSLSSLQLKTGHSMEALATMQAGVNGIQKPNLLQRLLKRLLSLPGRLIGR